MKKKILVTPRSVTKEGHQSLNQLSEAGYEVVFCTPGRQPTEDELLQLLPECIGYLAGVEKITARVLMEAKKLKVISRNGVGINNIDLETAKQLNIKVCRTEGANARGVVELTIALALSLSRAIPFSDAKMKSGSWERKSGFELKGRTFGIIGCGRIGRETASLALALGMKVMAYDPYYNDFFTPDDKFIYTDLNTLLATSDLISLHIPYTSGEKPVVNRTFLKAVKPGACLINTARGELIDTNAVLEALNRGQLGGLATDVYDQEPPGDLRLVNHEKVIATPHIGGFTVESVNNAMYGAIENLLNHLS